MESLRQQVTAKGVDVTGLDDNKVRQLARILGIKAPPENRTVELVDYTTKGSKKTAKYIKSSQIVTMDGTTERVSQGAFVRVDICEQLVKDLQTGIELAKAAGLLK